MSPPAAMARVTCSALMSEDASSETLPFMPLKNTPSVALKSNPEPFQLTLPAEP